MQYTTRYEQVRAFMRAYRFRDREVALAAAANAVRNVTLPPLNAIDRLTGRQKAALQQPRVQIFNLHHIFEDEVEHFRRLLDVLLKTGHRLTGYSEAVEHIWNGKIDAPYVVFSFDDGFKSCLRAAEILEEYGTAGCFFLSVGRIGETDPHRIKQYSFDYYRMPPMEFLSWDDVETLLKSGHEIGSHTMNHANLGRVKGEQMEDEIGQSFEVLKARTGEVKHFSWPFGTFADFSLQAARAVFEAGFQSCASAVRGCHVEAEQEKHLLCLRRNHALPSWPTGHNLYYMSRQSQTASAKSNGWPSEWQAELS
jgi:peptidoglycan/xylan/chitin deacetylase (PgdA/CDA1 family)